MECKVCSTVYAKACSLGTHLWKTHKLRPQEYYDRYVRGEGDGKCAHCGSPTKFRSIGEGYKEFCSRKCAALHIAADPERNAHKVAAMTNAMLSEHGVTNAAQLDSVKESRKATMMARHGVQYYSQSASFGDKYRNTMLERYNVTGAVAIPKVHDAIVASNMTKYGVPYYFCSRVREAQEFYADLLTKHECTLVEFGTKKRITFRCGKCGTVSTEQDLFIKLRDREGATPCSCCVPKEIHPSLGEMMLRRYVESLGFETAHYDRNFLGAYGADIVIESKRLIIEYDRLFWHTEKYHEYDYHLWKTETAERMGYRLIHVFSDEWEHKQEIVKSRIAYLLGVPGVRRIGARECRVRDVPWKVSSEFLERNHIQGDCPGSVRLGLYYGDELVALMTFGKSRFERGVTELLRYCTVAGTSVAGGAGRLLAEFGHRNGGLAGLVSYADRRYSGAEAFYRKIGFTVAGYTHPGYFYVDRDVRRSRFEFQKHRLLAKYPDHPEYAEMSETEIMHSRGMYRIYDCGNIKYVWGGNDDKKAQ